MEQIQFDSGMVSYRVNGKGVLRFNPADPNLYARFMQLGEKISQMEAQLNDIQDPAVQFQQADAGIKELLSWVFGRHNDFDALLGGVSLLAVATNGNRVLDNLLQALEPILASGVRQYAQELTSNAVAAAKQRRDRC